MHESITVAKVRKATTVKIPADGWVLISTPDEPFLTHINRRAELIKDGFVNENFSTLLIGRLSDSHPVVRFATKAESSAAEETRKVNEVALAKQNEDAVALRKKADASAAEKSAADHKAKIADINKENDATRNRDAHAVPKPQIQLETSSETGMRLDGPTVAEFVTAGYDPVNYPPTGYAPKSSPQEIATAIIAFDDAAAAAEAEKSDGARKELLLKNRGDLFKVATDLKLEIPSAAKKIALVELILAAQTTEQK